MHRRRANMLAAGLLAAFGTAGISFAQELETETARLPKQGEVNVGAGFEYQTSAEGTESAVPTIAEIGLMDRLELVLEAVPYADVSPKQGPTANGVGDSEVTLIGLVADEQPNMPAIALAGEVKIPTAKNDLLGSGEYDYTAYVILSKRFGNFDTHLNLGYTLLGTPSGVQADNIYDVNVAVQYFINDKVRVFAEFLGTTDSNATTKNDPTSVAGDAGDGGGGASGELAGGERVGTVGTTYSVTPSVDLSFGVSYDNNQAWLIHPGVMVKF